MPYCRECEAFMKRKETSCKKCGHEVQELIMESAKISPVIIESYGPEAGITVYSRTLVKRNYLLWFFLSFTWFGLAVYRLYNYSDLLVLDRYERPNEVPSPALETAIQVMTGITYVFFFLTPFIFPIINYHKFQRLHDYIIYHPEKQRYIPITGRNAALRTIFLFINATIGTLLLVFLSSFNQQGTHIAVAITGGVFILSAIICSYSLARASNNWQKALNERITLLQEDTLIDNY